METVMREKIGYCWQKAAECAARAEEAADEDTHELFIRFRDFWISAANRYEFLGAVAPGKTAERRPPSLRPELGTPVWRSRPKDAPTNTTAERLGAG